MPCKRNTHYIKITLLVLLCRTKSLPRRGPEKTPARAHPGLLVVVRRNAKQEKRRCLGPLPEWCKDNKYNDDPHLADDFLLSMFLAVPRMCFWLPVCNRESKAGVLRDALPFFLLLVSGLQTFMVSLSSAISYPCRGFNWLLRCCFARLGLLFVAFRMFWLRLLVMSLLPLLIVSLGPRQSDTGIVCHSVHSETFPYSLYVAVLKKPLGLCHLYW